ncbi:MAG: TPR end-of-group domain-containing protein [Candidatus Polarisedimenticolia bacterium]
MSTLYNLGCAAALGGDRKEALDWLGQAVSHGWSRGDQLAKDADLTSLRGDPAFDAIIAKARQNGAK